MRAVAAGVLPVLSCVALLWPCGPAQAQVWTDVTETTIGETAGWSNKVELADVDGDGLIDIVFANGGGYSSAGAPEPNRVFLNQGADAPFLDASEVVFGPTPDLARAIKVRDLSGDGVADIIVATTYQTQPRLYLGLGEGAAFVEVTEWYLPEQDLSAGDVEAGDVDGDGDLDLVFADWGPGSPNGNAGGVTRLWLNNGTGGFEDATAARMPALPVRWSWDLELVDVDNDWDLDVLVSCKSCAGSVLLDNDGTGHFVDASSRLPEYSNNYEFEAMDLTGDGWLDLVTINDGPGLSQHLFINDGAGAFEDGTEALWPAGDNPGADDNAAVFLDFDSDGDSDFLIGSLAGLDRLLINGIPPGDSSEGEGTLSMLAPVFDGANTPGTLGIQVADLDGDHRLDVVQSQGELAAPDKVYMGTGVAEDTAVPHLARLETWHTDGLFTIRARIHDGKSPAMPHDWSTPPTLMWAPDGVEAQPVELTWYGEYLWWATVDAPDGLVTWWVCATDAAGNETCSVTGIIEPAAVDPDPEPSTADGFGADGTMADVAQAGHDGGSGTPETIGDAGPTPVDDAAGPGEEILQEPDAESADAPDDPAAEDTGADAAAEADEPDEPDAPDGGGGGCAGGSGAIDLLLPALAFAGLATRRRRRPELGAATSR